MSTKKNTNEISETESKEAKLKSKYPGIVKMTFTVNERTLTAYVRNPTLMELDSTISSLQTRPISSSVGLFIQCFVDGDQELVELAKSNSGLAIAINSEIQKIIPLVSSQSIVI